MRHNNGERGFTLLEMLVALGLLAIIFTYLTGALNFGYRAWSLSDAINEQASVPVVRGFLRQHISGALPVRVSENRSSAKVSFLGQPNKVVFVSRMPDRVVTGGLYRLSLFADSNALKLNLQSYHPLRTATGLSQTRTLLDNVSQLNISYFGKLNKNTSAQWYSQWSRKDILPDLVRITLKGEAVKNWVPLTIPLRIK